MSNENELAIEKNETSNTADADLEANSNDEISLESEENLSEQIVNDKKKQNAQTQNNSRNNGMSQREYVQHLRERTQKSEREAKEARKEAIEAKKQAQDTLTRLESIEKQRRDQIVRSELKVEALKAGVVDFNDFTKIASDQISKIEINDDGEVNGISDLITSYKKSKPWLFKEDTKQSNTSSSFRTPAIDRVGKNDVSKLSDDDYKKAKADFLRNLKTKR